jgi:crotonobetainyl-CoA:carnitine CoA-transferase CaiB-like acyl-CoA transferase
VASILLSGVRVLDLTDERAELAGRVLADLGADVLKIEPPDGVSSRRRPPFDERSGSKTESLYWASVGVGKRSVVLDIMTLGGAEKLRELARRADVLIESAEPGSLGALGLGEVSLRKLNPRLIYASVTPYGQLGPKATWASNELTLEAAGGRLALQGDGDRPPLPIGYPQAYFHAGAQAAADIIIALNERDVSGLGQYLDASIQEAITLTLMNYAGYPPLTGGDPPGMGDDRASPRARPQGSGAGLGLCKCADGYVLISNTTHESISRVVPASVLPALRKARRPNEALEAIDWTTWVSDVRSGIATSELIESVYDAIRAFFAGATKSEIMTWAWENDVILGPVNTTRDLLVNPHFETRGFWQQLGTHISPGPSVRSEVTPISLDRPAPVLGADQSLLDTWLEEAPLPLPAQRQAERAGEAFAGLKVADFSWVAVGPLTAKALADHGATVVRIESSTKIDFVRTLLPFKDNEVGINRSHFMNNLNTSKLGAAINLATPEGRALARRIVDWADVVVENFTPGTMKRLGLDYETMSENHRDLIMISTCLMGQTGPWASFAGYGPQGASISGFRGITGWPDRMPVGPVGPYSDVIAPHYAVASLAAAIRHRNKTGEGQHIDVSQVESAIQFLGPLVLDEIVNGRTAGPAGHDSLTACPHGAYPTAGTERYIAIAVETPEQWRALKSVAPLDAFDDSRFDSLEERLIVRADIDKALIGWTAQTERRELEALLIEARVPAAVAQRPTELHEDPNLAARGFFVTLEHGECGSVPYDGLMTHFSAKKTMLHKAAPCIGEDTDYILSELIGLSEDEIGDLAIAGVFT